MPAEQTYPRAGCPCHSSVITAAVCLLVLILGFSPAAWASPASNSSAAPGAATHSSAPAPFFHLRNATLGYHGPSEDFTDLAEIRIGWFGPTDPNDPLTGDLWWAANLAIDEANAATAATSSPRPDAAAPPPFSDLPFRLVPRWSVDVWGTGVSQLTRMVYDEQPLALIGSIDSAATHLAEQVVAKAQLPLVSPIATDKTATLAGVAWMFSCAPSDAAIARVLVEEILRTTANGEHPGRDGAPGRTLKSPSDTPASGDLSLGGAPLAGARASQATPLHASVPQRSDLGGPTIRDQRQTPENHRADLLEPTAAAVQTPTIANRHSPLSSRNSSLLLLTTTDHDSRMTARELVRELSRRSRLPDARFDLPPGSALPTQVLDVLTRTSPNTVVIVAGAEDAARLTRALRAALPEARIIGGPTMGRRRFAELAGAAAEGVRFPLLHAGSAHADSTRFLERFVAARGHAPDYTAVLTYDTTRLLLAAIRRAGPNRARVREALIELSPWPGIAGPIRFDGTGQNTHADLQLGTIRDGVAVAMPRRGRHVLTQTSTRH